jgi:hypothetical protein
MAWVEAREVPVCFVRQIVNFKVKSNLVSNI